MDGRTEGWMDWTGKGLEIWYRSLTGWQQKKNRTESFKRVLRLGRKEGVREQNSYDDGYFSLRFVCQMDDDEEGIRGSGREMLYHIFVIGLVVALLYLNQI